MDNKTMLSAIVVILLGIFVVLLVQTNEETPLESVQSSLDETVEEVRDEIDDHTVEAQ